MKREDRHRLHRMLKEKGLFWPFTPDSFVEEFGIEFLTRKDPWSKKSLPQVKGRVVITVDLTDQRGNAHHGLSIPKEVAEKFLVLGIP